MSKAMEVYAANVGNTHSAAVEAVFNAGVVEGKSQVVYTPTTVPTAVTNDFVSIPPEVTSPTLEPAIELPAA